MHLNVPLSMHYKRAVNMHYKCANAGALKRGGIFNFSAFS